MVIAKGKSNLQGTMVLSNSDKDALAKNKEGLSKVLTEQVQSDTKNSNSKVEVSGLRQLSDDTFALDYECTGVSDGDKAKKALNQAVKQDEVKKAISKTSKKKETGSSKAEKPVLKPERKFNLRFFIISPFFSCFLLIYK
jgi:hypothetical protein